MNVDHIWIRRADGFRDARPGKQVPRGATDAEFYEVDPMAQVS
jgi:hypothetical protein